ELDRRPNLEVQALLLKGSAGEAQELTQFADALVCHRDLVAVLRVGYEAPPGRRRRVAPLASDAHGDGRDAAEQVGDRAFPVGNLGRWPWHSRAPGNQGDDHFA